MDPYATGGARIGSGPLATGLRTLVSFSAAGFVSVGLFWFLSTLIAHRDQGNVVAAVPRIEFSRLKRDTEVQEVKRVKPEIEKPKLPPSTPTVSAGKTAGVIAGVDTSALAPPGVDFSGVGVSGDQSVGLGARLAFDSGSDRDAVPELRIDPDYPPEARARHIEGAVTVEFDVGTDGGTRDVRVVDAEPPGVFERETIKAVSEWKYNPKIQDGKLVERKGLQVRLVFSLK
jgi:periplasmic protein TonB